MNRFSYDKILNGVDALLAETLRLKAIGISVIEFPTHLNSKKDIFEFVKREFPLDPFVEGEKSWDALADSIGGGVEQLRNTGVVVLIKALAKKQWQLSSAAIEFIDILFQIKKEHLPIDMKIYFVNPV